MSIKFSVLLPTKDRVDLLRLALSTIVDQNYANWEVIVSDNNSLEDVRLCVQDFHDDRIILIRSETSISVTDNWNFSLSRATGDYIIMLGDDDGLTHKYFSYLAKLVREFQEPELLYTGAYLFAYPGVLPELKDGFLRSYEKAEIFKNSSSPFFLSKEIAAEYVASSMQFRMRFDYNMQFFLMSSKLIKRLQESGPLFQSPYPDYYLSNVMFLEAKNILVVPKCLSIIGISKKSFGYYYFNNNEKDGDIFLQNFEEDSTRKRLKNIILPGVTMNTSWLLSMELLLNNVAKNYGLSVSYERYRMIQIISIFLSCKSIGFKNNKEKLRELNQKSTISEKLLFIYPLYLFVKTVTYFPKRLQAKAFTLLSKLTGTHHSYDITEIGVGFSTILDARDAVGSAI